jgi:hypothetical protein
MRTLKQAVRLAFAGLAVVAGSVAGAAPANAVATPAEACGSNYHEIDHHNLNGAVIHLLYNGTTDCVVTSKTDNLGKPTFVSAAVALASPLPTWTIGKNVDQGQYEYYAGPKKVDAPGKCIIWGGGVGPGTSATDAWLSQASHCG